MKTSILILLLLFYKSFSLPVANKKPLELIFENRLYISNQMANLSNADKLDTLAMFPFKSRVFTEMVDSSYISWIANENALLNEYLYVIAPSTAEYQRFQYYISDSITISILCSYLDYFKYDVHKGYRIPKDTIWELEEPLAKPGEIYGKKEKDWVRDALELLLYKTHFPALEKHSAEIANRLKNCNAPLMVKLKLLTLCNASVLLKPEKEKYLEMINKRIEEQNKNHKSFSVKDSIQGAVFGYVSVPLWVRVRLGDTLVEKNILKGLKSNNKYDITELAQEASFIWSDTTKKAFLSLFERDIPLCDMYVDNKYLEVIRSESKYKTCRSLQDSLLMALARHHPDDPMFSNLYSYSRRNADFCKPNEQVEYFKKFAVWMKEKYNYEIKFGSYTPYFKKDVSKDQSAIRDLCK